MQLQETTEGERVQATAFPVVPWEMIRPVLVGAHGGQKGASYPTLDRDSCDCRKTRGGINRCVHNAPARFPTK